MRIFITGGTGFIGDHVVRKLKSEDNDLLLLTRDSRKLDGNSSERLNLIQGNLSDIAAWKEEVKSFQPDTTIHMAWESIPDYGCETSIGNLKYGLDLVAVLAELGCKRFVSTGSCWEYGQQNGQLHEDMPVKPLNAFSAAKNALHWLGMEIAKEKDIQFIWARLFYVYGPGQREASLIPHIINCLRDGKEPQVKTPFARNDFVYVEDVADAISMLVKKCRQSAGYNIGSGYSTGVQDIIKLVGDKYNFHLYGDMPTCPDNASVIDSWADISRIKTEIGWEPKLNIKEGVKRLISYYE